MKIRLEATTEGVVRIIDQGKEYFDVPFVIKFEKDQYMEFLKLSDEHGVDAEITSEKQR